jgi:hypothetical protein
MKRMLINLLFVTGIYTSHAQTVQVDTIHGNENCTYFLVETPESMSTVLEFKVNDYSKGIGPEITDLKTKKTLKLSNRENLQGGFGEGIVTSEDPDGKNLGKLIIYRYKDGNIVKDKVFEGEDYYWIEFMNDDYMLISNRMDLSITSLQLYDIKKDKFIKIEMPSLVYESVIVSFNKIENTFAIGGMVKGGYPKNNDVFVFNTEGSILFNNEILEEVGGMAYVYCICKEKVFISIYGQNFIVENKVGVKPIGNPDVKFFFGAMVNPNYFLGYSSRNDKGAKTTGLMCISKNEVAEMLVGSSFSYENLLIENYNSFERKAYSLDKINNIIYSNGIPLNISIGSNYEFFKHLFSLKYNLLISKYHNYVYIIKFNKK